MTTFVSLGSYKQGDTVRVELVLTYTDDLGVIQPFSLVNTNIVSFAVQADEMDDTPSYEFTIVDLDEAGGTFAVEGDTTDWELGQYYWDARITPNGGPSWSTDTHIFTLGRRVS